jgi:dephospho-CoA kinase
MKLFGLAGTAGSGKDTVADILTEMFDMHNYSTSEYVRAVTRFLFDLPPEFSPIRDQLFEVATALRELNQASTVKMGILQAEPRDFSIQLISGLRSVGEAEAVREAGGLIIGVDADPKVRHERIQSRLRDAESQRTLEEFLLQDSHENEGVEKTGPMRGIKYVIEDADIRITNEGNLEELKAQLREKVGRHL